MAAICLYRTPEGFTQDEVDALRDAVYGDFNDDDPAAILLYRLAAKIAALLPPETP